jgi:hypothetical protein
VTIATSGPLPSCTFDTTVEASSPATLTYPCAGGSASVTFGSQVFTGSETGGTLSLSNVHTYTQHFAFMGTMFACDYKATQTISGSLTAGTLQYAYSEVLVTINPTCALGTVTCHESGPVTAM